MGRFYISHVTGWLDVQLGVHRLSHTYTVYAPIPDNPLSLASSADTYTKVRSFMLNFQIRLGAVHSIDEKYIEAEQLKKSLLALPMSRHSFTFSTKGIVLVFKVPKKHYFG
jgi:hypothetical protein